MHSICPFQKESQATISESSHVQESFIQHKVHLCLRPHSQDNTLNRPSSTWVSFKIRQKLGLLILGVTHTYIEPSHRLCRIDAKGCVSLAL